VAGPQSIKDYGWRQGSLLPDDLAQRAAATRFADWGPEDRAVLVSQDCDVVHSSYEVEPVVELIRAKISAVENALTRHGRNPRRLQLEAGAAGFLDFSVHDRWTVARGTLESHPPEPSLSIVGESLHVLVEWIAKRYTRPAFPDAFNDRRTASTKKIEKELKKNGKLITGLFLAIAPNGECSAEENYKVALRVTATKETLATKGVSRERQGRSPTRSMPAMGSRLWITRSCPRRRSPSPTFNIFSDGTGTIGATRANRVARSCDRRRSCSPFPGSEETLFRLQRPRTTVRCLG
jgi:hypothetical protein